jgi:hypothetical protein
MNKHPREGMRPMDGMTPDYTAEEADREQVLASQINQVIAGQQVDVILNAMTRVMAAVLASVRHESDENGPLAETSLFAGVVMNLHSLVHPDPNETIAGTLTVGSNATLTPEVMDAATALCPVLWHFLTGLRLHYDGRHVANSWTSVLLNVLLETGPNGEAGLERTQTILKDLLKGLPQTYAQMQQLRAIDDGANTSEWGNA